MEIITGKEELKKAILRGDNEIIVQGELYDKIMELKKFGNFGGKRGTLACIIGGATVAAPLLLAPFTRGKSLQAYSYAVKLATKNPELAGKWLTPAVAMAAVGGAVFLFGSLPVVLAIIKEYEVIDLPGVPPRLRLRKKRA